MNIKIIHWYDMYAGYNTWYIYINIYNSLKLKIVSTQWLETNQGL